MFWVSMGKGGGGGAGRLILETIGEGQMECSGNLIWVYITLNNNKS